MPFPVGTPVFDPWEPVELGRIWQPQFYDFVVCSEKNRAQKSRYMYGNPVKRGLVLEPKQWAWSSFRHYAYGEPGAVVVNEPQNASYGFGKSRDVGSRNAQASNITKPGAASGDSYCAKPSACVTAPIATV